MSKEPSVRDIRVGRVVSRTKTFQARDIFGRVGLWRWAACHSCKKKIPALVGAAGVPECEDCGVPAEREGA